MTQNFTIPSNPADREKIKKVLKTVSDSFTRIEAERDLIKDEIGALVEEFGIPKRTLNKMARTYHKQNFDEVISDQETFEVLYENVMNLKA